jgi:hypothetical protein
MPDFTIEATYYLPVYRHRTYSADTIAEACRLAVEDENWDTEKFDYETAGENYVTGIWPASVAPYSQPSIAVPAHFGETVQRKAGHFETLLGLLKMILGDIRAGDMPRRRRKRAPGIAKAASITTGTIPPTRISSASRKSSGSASKPAAFASTGGGTRDEPRIFFTGFWNQGDGACFEAYYAYAKGAPRRIREYAPQDEALHRIADGFAAIQRRNFYQLRAETTHRGHYYHARCMAVSVERDSPTYQAMTAGADDIVIEALRDLADWLYRQLEREYDYLSSDEAVDETIAANAYTFTASGRRFG